MFIMVVLQLRMDFAIILWHVIIKAQLFIAMHIQFELLFLTIVSSIMKWRLIDQMIIEDIGVWMSFDLTLFGVCVNLWLFMNHLDGFTLILMNHAIGLGWIEGCPPCWGFSLANGFNHILWHKDKWML